MNFLRVIIICFSVPLTVCDIAVIFQHQDVEISSESRETKKGSDWKDVKCIREANMNFALMTMADTSRFREESLAECVRFCLGLKKSTHTHLLISYYDAFLFGDEFNCICADREAFKNSPVLPEANCDKLCPKSFNRCGDVKDNAMSVYCLKQSCQQVEIEPICSKRLPHDSHGCVNHDNINWIHAHNVRNFSSDTNDNMACVWECHDYHPSAMYSLTRKVGGVLTCSCGYVRAFEPLTMVNKEFCTMLPDQSTYYSVNCISDLYDKAPETEVSPGEACKDIFPVGCIYDELLKTNSIVTISNVIEANSQICHPACSSTFPTSRHVALRYFEKESKMQCVCLKDNDWNTTLVGPDSACDIPCQPEGSGLLCGGPKNGGFPASSLYCLHRGRDESTEVTDGEEEEGNVILNLQNAKPLLEAVGKAVKTGSLVAEIIVGLMSFICLILIALITYLCFAKGN